jgi:hypothetical protein
MLAITQLVNWGLPRAKRKLTMRTADLMADSQKFFMLALWQCLKYVFLSLQMSEINSNTPYTYETAAHAPEALSRKFRLANYSLAMLFVKTRLTADLAVISKTFKILAVYDLQNALGLL